MFRGSGLVASGGVYFLLFFYIRFLWVCLGLRLIFILLIPL